MKPKKTIYIIRHGQTDYNLKNIIQGSGVDSDLNHNGLVQSRLFFEKYSHVTFDKIYTSTLKRTIQSVAGFIEAGVEYEPMSEWNEIGWGIMEGIESTPEKHCEFMSVVNEWRKGRLDYALEGAETPLQLYERQKAGWNKLKEKEEEKTILIAMHGRALRSFLCLLTGKPLAFMDDFEHTNLCLYKFELHFDNSLKMILNCDTTHLDGHKFS